MDGYFRGIEDEMIRSNTITNGEDAPSQAGAGAEATVAAMTSRTKIS
jgi:hypothetical protein